MNVGPLGFFNRWLSRRRLEGDLPTQAQGHFVFPPSPGGFILDNAAIYTPTPPTPTPGVDMLKQISSVSGGADLDIINTATYTDVPGLSITIVLQGTAQLISIVFNMSETTGTNLNVSARVSIDGSSFVYLPQAVAQGISQYAILSASVFVTGLSLASHVFKLQVSLVGGSGHIKSATTTSPTIYPRQMTIEDIG